MSPRATARSSRRRRLIPSSGRSTASSTVPSWGLPLRTCPSSRRMPTIASFSASASAVKQRTSSSRARFASSPASRLPIPWPCQPSTTATASSATLGSSADLTNRATPTPSPHHGARSTTGDPFARPGPGRPRPPSGPWRSRPDATHPRHSQAQPCREPHRRAAPAHALSGAAQVSIPSARAHARTRS